VAPDRSRHPGAFVVAATVVLALDQLTKQWALSALADGPVDLVGSLRLSLVFNDRAAFGLGVGNTTVIALVGIALVAVLARFGWQAHGLGPAIGFGIILGGALGNLTDRALRAGNGFLGGRVVDMVDPQWWPVFNLADASLWVGVGVLLLTWRSDEPKAEAVS
jgi:signal peptidase II